MKFANDAQGTDPTRYGGRSAIRVGICLIAAASMALTACSSTGGKPAESGSGGGGANTADTPRMTIAMITHEQPGDSFWDLIRKGAQAAADKDNFELRYSNKNVGPDQATLV